MNCFITSESVTEGHPDKVCDQISDAILDDLIRQDPDSRVAIECLVTTGSVHVAGEVTSKGYVDVQKVVRSTLKEIGYTNPAFGIDYEDAGVWSSIHEQSPDISLGITENQDKCKEQGAGDQGMMYGFACNETPELMPLSIYLAHKLSKRLATVRKENLIPNLGPDGKSQVTIEYNHGRPKRLEAIIIAQQHTKEINESDLKKEILEKVIEPELKYQMDNGTKIYINATGQFVVGGPEGDTGVTGRKIIVDTYGGVGRHGGGAFSGKDPSKVDRSAAYSARYIAKNIVASGLANRCEIQLSYAIGIAKPLGINIDCFETGRIPDCEIADLVKKNFPLTPKEIIDYFNLKRPIYKKTAAYGHFGRAPEKDGSFSWEKTDKVELLKEEGFALSSHPRR